MKVHQRIMNAAKKGTGLRLTAEEVFELSLDNAISTAADSYDEADREKEMGHPHRLFGRPGNPEREGTYE